MRFSRLIRWLRRARRANIETKFTRANIEINFALISIAAAIVLFVVWLLILLGAVKDPIWSFIPLITGGVAGVCALWIEYREWIAAVWKSAAGKITVGLVTYIFSSLILVDSDRLIFLYTKLDPTLFPKARNLMSVFTGIRFLLIIAWFALLLVYIAQLISYCFQRVYANKKLFSSRPYRIARILLDLRKTARKNPNEILNIGIFSGLAMLGLAVFVVLRFISSREYAEPYFKKLIDYSSFYTNNGKCQNLDKDSRIMVLSDKEEVVQVNYAPDGSPVFSVRPCPREFNQVVP